MVLYGTCTCTRIQYAVPQNPYQIKSHTTDIFTSALQKKVVHVLNMICKYCTVYVQTQANG